MNIRKNFVVAGLCFLSLCLTSCRMGQEDKAQDGLFLVNVLDKKFFDDCALKAPGGKVYSVNVSMDDLETYAGKHWDKQKTNIVVYCANYKCTASGESAKILKDLGYNHVWAYEGGTAEWMNKGFPVEGPCKQGYLKDYEKPAGHEVEAGVSPITAEELKAKIDAFSAQ
ncbi:MAG: rhodanese-like domain-containing protein [Candidatus Babeliales bacterium]